MAVWFRGAGQALQYRKLEIDLAPWLRLTLATLLAVARLQIAAGAQEASATDAAISLAKLASEADVVVLAQARDTDYVFRRGFPVEGSAFLRVLVAYKTEQPLDIVEVYEQGLNEHECYFPKPTVFEEGRRYLLFLKKDKDKPERFLGLKFGCALDVLVDRDNHYVLRLPVTGIQLSDPLSRLEKRFEFADAYAVEDDQSLPPHRRDELLAAGYLKPEDDHFVYARGGPLSEVRKLMGLNAVSTVRRN